ncbi:MAG TPA: hypothetical protein VFS20_04085 [Longimicrobium sp.]|nr:hypothetical protein [Longimicrobium sp.]
MKKLILQLDELRVESFATAHAAVEYDAPAFSPQTGCRNCPTPP